MPWRELLRHARMRAARPAPVQDPGRGAHRRLRIHRGLLQSTPPSFVARLSLTHRLRAPVTKSERSIPAHTSLPSCSRPSRSGLETPERCPGAAAVLDRRCDTTAEPSCGPGRKNGSTGGRTKEYLKTGGQNAVRSDTLIPSPHPSTKPGQVHASRTARSLHLHQSGAFHQYRRPQGTAALPRIRLLLYRGLKAPPCALRHRSVQWLIAYHQS